MPDPTNDPLLGRSIRQFRIDAKLGEGGMGAVYRAMDTKLERPIALKVIRPELCQNPDFLARFQREAKAAARFKHPNAIEIYEYGDGAETDGLVYMAFEFVNGRELRELIRERGHLDPETSVSILGQVLSALERAHGQGIVHRDLKPQNVMIEQGEGLAVKILDFGIAKIRDQNQSAALTQAGQIMGTVAYMSPEQTEGAEVDARSDLYSVGVMFFQMLTGKLPFNGKSALEVIKQHRQARVPLARDLQPDVPEALDAVVQRAMAKKPEERWQTARDFRLALQALGLGPQNVPSDTRGLTPAPTGGAANPPSGAVTGPLSSAVTVQLSGKAGAETPARDYRTGATGKFFDALEGRTLDDKYLIEGKLGEGGMGAVFKARHKLLNTTVAIKVVHPQLADRKDITERFLREARAALEFLHPNAIPTRDFGRTRDGLLYMTQDFSPGRSLRKLLQDDGRLSAPRALSIARQALLALTEAHAKNIVHRDLKPENMLVEKDEQGELVRVCDFGIAKILDGPGGDDSGESLTGAQVIGTPHYMAPEQACADEVDGRTDIYAIGCVLYELLTGEKPFVARSAKDVLMKQISVPPVPPRERAPSAGITPPLEAVVLKALAKEPAARFQSAGEFVDASDALGVDLPRTRGMTSRMGVKSTTTELAATLPPARPARQGRAGLAVAVVAGMVGIAALIVWQAPEDTVVGGLRARLLASAGGPGSSGTQGAGGTLPPDVTPDTRIVDSPRIGVRPTTESAPPQVTESAPPPETEATPPPVTETAPPPVTEAAPPRATETAPPPVTESTPPTVTESAPPRATESAPPRVTETAPPPVTESAPPRVNPTDDIPSAEAIPEAEPAGPDPRPSGAGSTPAAGVVERPIDPYAGTPRDPAGSEPTTTSGTGRTSGPRSDGGRFDTGRTTEPQTAPGATGPAEARELVSRGVTFKIVRVPDHGDLWVTATEVTVAQYVAFARAHAGQPRVAEPLQPLLPARRTGRTTRRGGDEFDAIPEEQLSRPITGVDFAVARRLAEWFELRLLTGAEWLAAARAEGGRTAGPGSVVGLEGMLNEVAEWTDEELAGSRDRSGSPTVGKPRDGQVGIRLARRR